VVTGRPLICAHFCAEHKQKIMATLKTEVQANWATAVSKHENSTGLWDKFIAFADRQQERKVMWFFLALTIQGIFFLPMPAVLMYYYNASITVLLITMSCFFTNIIAFMGGAGIRTVLLLSVLSILIQVAVLVLVIVR
jgi:hypothetical protein